MGRDHRETRACLIGIAVIGVYTLLVLATGRVRLDDFAALLAVYLAGSYALWLMVGLFGAGVLLFVHRPRAGQASGSPIAVLSHWAVERWRRDRLLALVWPPLLFAALMATFNAFKQLVLIEAGFQHDALFAAADRALFLGHDPWVLTHALFGGPLGTWLIDKAYHGWFVAMSLGVIVCAFLPARSWRLRTQYLLSYLGVWIGIGSVLAFLLPAAGPCFYHVFLGGAEFLPLLDRLAADQVALQTWLPGDGYSALANQARLLAAHGSDTLKMGAGISAMPSVHNALSALFALAAFRIDRRAGWAMTGYAVLIWIGSIHLGWHYAIDGIVSIALTIALWKAMGVVTERLERPLFAPGRTPAFSGGTPTIG